MAGQPSLADAEAVLMAALLVEDVLAALIVVVLGATTPCSRKAAST